MDASGLESSLSRIRVWEKGSERAPHKPLLWELRNADGVQPRRSNTDAKKSELLAHDVTGGFPQPIYDTLRRDPPLLARIAREILEAHFPASIHDDILEAVGLDLGEGTYSTTRRKRNPAFRERILRVYVFRCATCSSGVTEITWENTLGSGQRGGTRCTPRSLKRCCFPTATSGAR